MKYVILFEDNDEFGHMRQQYMADHLQFLKDHAGQIEAAGPMKDGKTADPAGGIWIVDVADADAAQKLVETDPFWPTGLRQSVRVLEWTVVFADGEQKI